ncbi:MAG: D-alanine--D-alanine ligase [Luteolibacter sp.]|jgi:D-alanine-D-alanine ligase
MQLSEINISVLMGGPGSERQVSLASGRAVAEALQSIGLRATAVDLPTASLDGMPAETGLAFNTIHGTFGEDGQLQDLLEKRGIPYTGAGSITSRTAFDKHLSKAAFVAAGVPTPRSEILDLSKPGATPGLPLPLVVKPPREGSSVGVHIVREPAQLAAALEDAARFGTDALVEEFIEGLELTVGILNDQPLPVVHIIPPDGVYDMASKYPWLSGAQGSQYICPADLDEATTAAVQQAALAAHRALGVEVYSRVDVLLEAATHKPCVLEANTIPGMTATSLLPKAAAACGIAFPELCRIIAEQSLLTPRP